MALLTNCESFGSAGVDARWLVPGGLNLARPLAVVFQGTYGNLLPKQTQCLLHRRGQNRC